MAPSDLGAELKLTQQSPQPFGHAGPQKGTMRTSAGEGVGGQVGRDHREMLCQCGQQAAPAEVARAGAMQQQHARALPHDLHMPLDAARLNLSAVWRMGPGDPVFGPGHARVEAVEPCGLPPWPADSFTSLRHPLRRDLPYAPINRLTSATPLTPGPAKKSIGQHFDHLK